MLGKTPWARAAEERALGQQHAYNEPHSPIQKSNTDQASLRKRNKTPKQEPEDKQQVQPESLLKSTERPRGSRFAAILHTFLLLGCACAAGGGLIMAELAAYQLEERQGAPSTSLSMVANQ